MIKRVLIFDDDPTILSIMKYVLEDKGLEVLACDNCNNVIEKVKEFAPSMIIMDNNIPDIGGIATTKIIKQHQELAQIPVIYFTANMDIVHMAKEAGADAFLSKPFDLIKLYAVIEQLLPEIPDQQEKQA